MEENDAFSLLTLPTAATRSPEATRSLKAAEKQLVTPLQRRTFLQRLSTPFIRLFRRLSFTHKAVSAQTEGAGFACTAQAKAPLVFKGNVSVTMTSPLGTYAGKSGCDRRKLAEQQFHRMESSRGSTVN